MNINRVILTGNLTRDPDVRHNPGTGVSICKLGVAIGHRRKPRIRRPLRQVLRIHPPHPANAGEAN